MRNHSRMDEAHLKAQEREYQDRKYNKRSRASADHLIDPERFANRYLVPEYVSGGMDRGFMRRIAFEKLIDVPFVGDLHQARRMLSGKAVLDYACGDGYFSVFLALLGAQVFGFDLSPRAIEVANLKAKSNCVNDRAHFAVLDASALALPSNWFDLALGVEALHHVVFYSNVSSELYRVMKPGGRVVFAENLGHNPLLELLRRRFSLKAVETTLKYPDVESFGKPFHQLAFHELSLFFMVKRLFRRKLELSHVRTFLKGLWHVDQCLLRLIPKARRFCGEVVVVLVK